ncbi:Hypothetical predicted protein [Marmota monax]|uniref:Uncharacterized protein n=1 Tax=Marmota monax TaxID=9995 RepID=A0A5E4AGU9_MARMO|nr:Hypothetical predicted protein [Marmota monax]
MEEEGVKNFKELRAKFQKFDAPTLPGPIKFPAGDSQKDEVVCARPIPILAKGKPISSNHNQPLPYSCNGESPPQKTKVTQRSEMRKSSSSPGPLAKSTVCSTGNFQKASVLLDVTGSKAEVTPKERVVASSSFRDKLRNWEKVSSQRNETSSALPLSDCGGKAFHLEGQKSMGLAPEKPRKKLETKGAQTLPSQRHLTAQRKSLTISEDPSSRLSPRGRKSQEISSPERGLAGSTCQPVYECQLDSQTPEKQPDIRQNQFPKTKPLPSTESLGPPPAKPSKPPRVDLQAFQRQPASIAKAQNEGKEQHGPHTEPAGSHGSGACIPSATSLSSATAPPPRGSPSLLILLYRLWQFAHEVTDLQELAPYLSWASSLPLRALHLITGNLSKRKKKMKSHQAGRQ